MSRSPAPTLVIHGGTGALPGRARAAAIRRSLRRVLAEAYAELEAGSALAAVVRAVDRWGRVAWRSTLPALFVAAQTHDRRMTC